MGLRRKNGSAAKHPWSAPRLFGGAHPNDRRVKRDTIISAFKPVKKKDPLSVSNIKGQK